MARIKNNTFEPLIAVLSDLRTEFSFRPTEEKTLTIELLESLGIVTKDETDANKAAILKAEVQRMLDRYPNHLSVIEEELVAVKEGTPVIPKEENVSDEAPVKAQEEAKKVEPAVQATTKVNTK